MNGVYIEAGTYQLFRARQQTQSRGSRSDTERRVTRLEKTNRDRGA